VRRPDAYRSPPQLQRSSQQLNILLKTSVGSAYFEEIISIDNIYNATSINQASYLTIIKKDGTTFNVYVSGSRSDVDSFLKPANLCMEKIKSF
jgi:hypothetical protein